MNNILIVEDDIATQQVYTLKLSSKGYNVDVAMNGEIAIAKVKESKPDLILLDLILPVMDGFAFLKYLRDKKLLSDMCVMVLTNMTTAEYKNKMMDLGADSFIEKVSVTLDDLVSEIERVLSEAK